MPLDEALSAGGNAAMVGPSEGNNNPQPGYHDNGRGGNTFVNDPCLDPPPTAPPPENRRRTVQSETEIAVLNTAGSMGKKMVAGYNESYGLYNDKEGLNGFAYSVDGGNTWIDGGGLPPRTPTGSSNFEYSGDPVVVVHHPTQRFFYASITRTTPSTRRRCRSRSRAAGSWSPGWPASSRPAASAPRSSSGSSTRTRTTTA